MGFFDSVGKIAKGVAEQALSSGQKQLYNNAKKQGVKIGGKTIQEWDYEWQSIGYLSSTNWSNYNQQVGLYKARLHGEIVYIGRATEFNNGGFRKRLNDYTRESGSARLHSSGKKMYEHDKLSMEILITGTDAKAAEVATKLEKLMIGKYQPTWNKQLL